MSRLLAPVFVFALALSACAGPDASAGLEVPASPAPPPLCLTLTGGGPLAQALSRPEAQTASAICLAPGVWEGPVTLDRPLHLWGPRSARVVANGPGSVITVAAPNVTVAGLTLDGTGGRFYDLDAAIHVIADDARVEGVQVVHAVYGVLVEKAKRALVLGNHIIGDASTTMGMRGDTIRLWEAYDATIADNLVEDGRDVVVWYSSRNILKGNRVLRGRYGTHLMYSHDNTITDNAYVDGVVGVFVMYSRRVTLTGNLVLNASGASGMALGLKDSGNLTITGNAFIRNTTGIYVDDSPSQAGETLVIAKNAIRQHTTAVIFHTTPRRTTLSDNDFIDNARQLIVDAGVNPAGALWEHNHFDDYTGYDLDGDGLGDLPYEVASASEDLVAQRPDLAYFTGSPALGLIDVGSRLLPLWEARTLLTDARPRLGPNPLPSLRTTAPSTGIRAPEITHEN